MTVVIAVAIALGILLDSAYHRAGLDSRLCSICCVNAEHGDNSLAVLVVARGLKSGYCAERHLVVVRDNELDHILVGLGVLCESCAHIVCCGSRRPQSVLVNEVLVLVCGIVELELGLSGSLENRVWRPQRRTLYAR